MCGVLYTKTYIASEWFSVILSSYAGAVTMSVRSYNAIWKLEICWWQTSEIYLDFYLWWIQRISFIRLQQPPGV